MTNPLFRAWQVTGVLISGVWYPVAWDREKRSSFHFETYQLESLAGDRVRPIVGDPGRYAYRFTSGDHQYFGPATAIQALRTAADD